MSFTTGRLGWLARLLLGVAFIGMATPAGAQEVTIIEDENLCSHCELRIERRARVGEPDGAGLLPLPRTFSADSEDRFYISSYQSPGEIFIYKNDKFIRSVIREGEGPGEFVAVDVLHVSRGDTIYAFDARQGRVTVLTPDLNLVETARIPGRVSEAVTLASGHVIINAHLPTSDAVGFPLHILRPDGSIARSFGAEGELYRADMRTSRVRRLAAAGGNSFWAAHMIRYVVELWDVDGNKRHVIERNASWFPPRARIQSPTREKPPSPTINSIHMDRHGLLWVVSAVAEDHWYEGLRLTGRTPEGSNYIVEDLEKVLGTVIEIIDPNTGKLLLSERFERRFGEVLNDSTLVSISQDANGASYLDLWQVELNR